MRGFPGHNWPWCIDRLKTNTLDKNLRIPNRQRPMVQFESQKGGFTDAQSASKEGIGVHGSSKVFSSCPRTRGGKEIVQYLGIAADEPKRLERLDGVSKISPLAAIGWDESKCRKWCEDNDLLSPIYTTATRGGCWFCHNQGVDQLRLLRKNYPDLWLLMLKWDKDSPVTFHADGHTVHDFDRRFQMEDDGFIKPGERFLWSMLDSDLVNYRLF